MSWLKFAQLLENKNFVLIPVIGGTLVNIIVDHKGQLLDYIWYDRRNDTPITIYKELSQKYNHNMMMFGFDPNYKPRWDHFIVNKLIFDRTYLDQSAFRGVIIVRDMPNLKSLGELLSVK